MYRGLTVSIAMHAGLLAWALVTFAGTKPHPPLDSVPVEVAIISVKDLETRQKKGETSAKLEEAAAQPKPAPEVSKQEAPKPKPAPPPPAAEPPPPTPEPPKVEAPKPADPPPQDPIADKLAMLPPEKAPPPEPKPDDIALQLAAEEQKRKIDAEAKARAEAEAERKRKEAEAKAKEAERKRKEAEAKAKAAEAERKRKEAEKAKQFDASRIAELIDKSPDKRGAPAPQSEAPATPTKAKGPVAGSPTGTDRVNTAREEDMLKGMINQALKSCWRVQQSGLPVVTLSWKLKPDGQLAAEPQVVSAVGTPEAAIAARAALAAVQKCAPFKLPPNTYALWRDITWDFDPSRMQ